MAEHAECNARLSNHNSRNAQISDPPLDKKIGCVKAGHFLWVASYLDYATLSILFEQE
jgi:hypothetical protein